MTETAPSPSKAAGFLALLRAGDRHYQTVEVALCFASLILMVLLAFASVFLRAFRGIDLLLFTVPEPVAGFDNVARHLVIWVGMLGASLATSEGRHISIEALPLILSERGKQIVDILVNAASMVVTGILLWLAIVYLQKIQIPNTTHLFEIQALSLNVYRWPFLLVVPIGLAVMCLRFMLRASEALLLDNRSYQDLRREQEGRDVDELESSVQEDAAVGLLLDHSERVARESGAVNPLTQESARDAVRDVLKSDRQPSPPQPSKLTPSTPILAPSIDLQDRSRLPRKGIRSTDEIPIYRDLADDEDKADPEFRRGVVILDSSEELEAEIDDFVSGNAETSRLEVSGDASETNGPPPPDSAKELAVGLDANDPESVDPDSSVGNLAAPKVAGPVANSDEGDALASDEGRALEADALASDEGPPLPPGADTPPPPGSPVTPEDDGVLPSDEVPALPQDDVDDVLPSDEVPALPAQPPSDPENPPPAEGEPS